jgi:polar amino acid transport system permease protein
MGMGFETRVEPPRGGLTAGEAGPPDGSRGLGRRRSQRRDAVISTVSTIVFFALVVALIAFSPGVNKVVESFFSLTGFKDSFGTVSEGFWLNVKLMLVAEAIVLVVALGIAVIRSLPGPVMAPLRVVGLIYTDVFRGIPLILVIFIVGLGLPSLQLEFISDQSVFTYGVISLVLVYSAYVTEVYRAGIESVHPSQLAGARSLGLTHWQSMRFVVLPQAVRRVIPPLLNDFIGLQKDTALVGLLGLVEVARAAENYASSTFNFTGYTMAALLFIAVTIPLARVTDWLIERDRRRMRATGG